MSSDFNHDTTTDPHEITILSSGKYLIHFTAPLESSTGIRVSPKMQVLRKPTAGSFAAIESAVAMQGYIRGTDIHFNSSLNYSGLVELTAGDVIKLQTIQDGAIGTVTIPSLQFATVFIEKVDTSSNYYYATDGYTTENWNTDAITNLVWSAPAIEDSAHFSSPTATQIDINSAGDYLLIYNNSFSSVEERRNVKIVVNLNGTALKDTELKSHYIRSSNGHNRSSGSLVYFLRDVPANSFVEITHTREANSGIVTKFNDAQIILIRK